MFINDLSIIKLNMIKNLHKNIQNWIKLHGFSMNTSYFTCDSQNENQKFLLSPQSDSDIQDFSGRHSPEWSTMSELDLCFGSGTRTSDAFSARLTFIQAKGCLWHRKPWLGSLVHVVIFQLSFFTILI